ncbi:hypothetical protein ACM61V_04575 [Sphingomonas sp. TX0543]|uniref:hypothetical protein n=1 Tax=Sphingomonas sp. TX0543 TaxID=3399682 RepID=UPI003AFAA51B
MQYGIIPSGQAGEALLRICRTSGRDDFPDGVRLDPGNYETSWSANQCVRGRTLPIVNVASPEDDIGVVFRNDAADFAAYERGPDRQGRNTLLLGAVAAALVGGLVAALTIGRRK